ncbi:hypothetical protein ACNKHU_07250 [Shigella flexneri]
MRAPLAEEAKFFGYTSRVTLGGEDAPVSSADYVYESQRQAVAAMASFFRINPDEILVAHDELDLCLLASPNLIGRWPWRSRWTERHHHQ